MFVYWLPTVKITLKSLYKYDSGDFPLSRKYVDLQQNYFLAFSGKKTLDSVLKNSTQGVKLCLYIILVTFLLTSINILFR